ncbi:CBS domain-containing protein [Streptomyces sp. A7024]|uniref:CBS domain-containing protein n=1 Tax=Streptomyces coryli TaxID=1128680 RepID=A0A6G4UAP4_9ACTN|nr:CBS domain-containing protein [Streptomyces coryli]NGN69299.1 CBS domain-containing protein [Streptomyces coryli]
MDQQVRDVMTNVPVAVGALTAVTEVAHRMRAEDIGAVLVTEGGELRGVVTDRDLVVRVMAEGKDPGETTVMSACSTDLVTVGPDEPAVLAVQLMRKHALRRLPVVRDGEVVGIVALGDLAVGRDPESALGEISAAAPNR